jgi:hypothetical protein
MLPALDTLSAKDLFLRLDQLLLQLRPAFKRNATFHWFFLFVWSFLLRLDTRGVTSCLNALGLSEAHYHSALHFFRSSALDDDELAGTWYRLVSARPDVHRLHGRPVHVCDDIKIPKAGRRTPAVKRLHQESENNDKPPWIQGHFFGALGMLLGKPGAMYHTPLRYRIHDGIIDGTQKDVVTSVMRMVALVKGVVRGSAYLIADAFFANETFLVGCTSSQVDVITRARSSTVAYRPLPTPPIKRTRGRPRLWGERVKLSDEFAQNDGWTVEELRLYDGVKTVKWRTLDLHWYSHQRCVRFVLVVIDDRCKAILLSTDQSLTGTEIIEAYSWRFRIETHFRAMHQTLDAFGYHFWTKAIERQRRWSGNLDIGKLDKKAREKVNATVAACERFVNVAGISLGLLQILSLEMSASVWKQFPGWLRTVPMNKLASELVVRLTLQHQAQGILLGRPDGLLLPKILDSLVRLEAAEGVDQTVVA